MVGEAPGEALHTACDCTMTTLATHPLRGAVHGLEVDLFRQGRSTAIEQLPGYEGIAW